jgi:hypothetical protein
VKSKTQATQRGSENVKICLFLGHFSGSFTSAS